MVADWPLAKTFPTGRALVASKHPLAGAAGIEMLRRGGNAIDAAIATSFASGVIEPYSSGIGGGGLALYQLHGQQPGALHFGMRAPVSAREDMYETLPGTRDIDLFGWPRTRGDENVHGPRSVALPGQISGLHRLWKLGGRLDWGELIQPAVELARGAPVDWQMSLHVVGGLSLLSRFATSRSIFLPQGRPPQPDLGLGADVLEQPGLSRTLESIARDPGAWDRGRIAESIVKAVEGRFTIEELRGEPIECEPLTISFAGLDVHLMPGATGGPTSLEWLGILRELDPPADDGDPGFWWAIIKAGEVALRDRLERLCDPEYGRFPEEILDPTYHRRAAEAIVAGETGPTAVSEPATGTSHLSVVDEENNVIAITQTLLSGWGSGLVTPDTGILLNNGMMWFDPTPGHVNSVEGGKRPLANMCPVLVTHDEKPCLAYGASGGRKIMPAVVQIFLRVSILGQSLAEAIAAPRIDISRDEVVADARFGQRFARDLAGRLGRPVILREPALGASPWASPVGLMRREDGRWSGGADPYTLACVLGD